jgi:hypothetical protein
MESRFVSSCKSTSHFWENRLFQRNQSLFIPNLSLFRATRSPEYYDSPLSLEALFGVENQAQASKTPFIFANIPQEQQFALATLDLKQASYDAGIV